MRGIATTLAGRYRAADKAERGRMLDEVVAATGWSRDHARRQLTRGPKPGSAARQRQTRARKYSDDSLAVLRTVWSVSGGLCGKYLVPVMPLLLDGLETHRELVRGQGSYSSAVRAELESMSPATVDRYLAPARATALHDRWSTLQLSAQIEAAGTVAEPGYFYADLASGSEPPACGTGPAVSLTCRQTGWTFARVADSISNHPVLDVLRAAVSQIPFAVTEVRFSDACAALITDSVVDWATQAQVTITTRDHPRGTTRVIRAADNGSPVRGGPTPESDGSTAIILQNRWWDLITDRLNFLRPIRKPLGSAAGSQAVRRSRYDEPTTPCDRLLAAGVLSRAQGFSLQAARDAINPAAIPREIAALRARLTDQRGGTSVHHRTVRLGPARTRSRLSTA